ncbi:hypothetical protein SH528x_004040 [Novipirellula sp. SH528]|uniref:hypothetical protein n=1 Tax=Novipirellula sp. SH528 TaxID=3454466 RepID=UPI003FA00A7F
MPFVQHLIAARLPVSAIDIRCSFPSLDDSDSIARVSVFANLVIEINDSLNPKPENKKAIIKDGGALISVRVESGLKVDMAKKIYNQTEAEHVSAKSVATAS